MSFIIASLAFLVLVARIGTPFHKVIAGVIYATSWLPVISALTHKSWIHVKTNPWVRRYIPLAIAAAILVSSAWVGMNLRPTATSKAYSVSDIRTHISEDINNIGNIDREMKDLFARSDLLKLATSSGSLRELEMLAPKFLIRQQRLTEMIESYEAYYTIDRQQDSRLHDQAFLVWFAALSVQQNSILSMTELGTSEQIRSAMNGANSSKDINNDIYDTLLRSVVLPTTLVKIGYSATYLRLITGEKARQANASDSIEWLGEIAQSNIDAYYDKLEANSNIVLDALKTVTHPM